MQRVTGRAVAGWQRSVREAGSKRDGLYTALLIKVLAYLLALRLQAKGVFSKLTITQIMRNLRREEELRDFL